MQLSNIQIGALVVVDAHIHAQIRRNWHCEARANTQSHMHNRQYFCYRQCWRVRETMRFNWCAVLLLLPFADEMYIECDLATSCELSNYMTQFLSRHLLRSLSFALTHFFVFSLFSLFLFHTKNFLFKLKLLTSKMWPQNLIFFHCWSLEIYHWFVWSLSLTNDNVANMWFLWLNQ